MKNKGYAELGGGGGQIRCIMGDVPVEKRSLCGGESSPPTTPLSKIRYQNLSLPRVQPNKVVPTLILSFDKLSLGLSQKIFFSLTIRRKGFRDLFLLYTVFANIFAVLKWCRWRHYMFIVVDTIASFSLRFSAPITMLTTDKIKHKKKDRTEAS